MLSIQEMMKYAIYISSFTHPIFSTNGHIKILGHHSEDGFRWVSLMAFEDTQLMNQKKYQLHATCYDSIEIF